MRNEKEKVYSILKKLPTTTRNQCMNSIITKMWFEGKITQDEANEARADAMKASLFNNYPEKSAGMQRVESIMEQGFVRLEIVGSSLSIQFDTKKSKTDRVTAFMGDGFVAFKGKSCSELNKLQGDERESKEIADMLEVEQCNLMDEINDYADKIVTFYTCPSECTAPCCKIDRIVLGRDEYNSILSNVSEQASEILKNQTVEIHDAIISGTPIKIKKLIKEKRYRQFKTTKCPLLQENRCSIYGHHPKICRSYPISLVAFESEKNVQIIPCSMGLEIMLDYVAMLFEGLLTFQEEGGRSTVDLYKVMYVQLTMLKMACEDRFTEDKLKHGIRIGVTFPMFDPSSGVECLLNYLQTEPDEVRKNRRDDLMCFLTQFTGEYNEVVDFVKYRIEETGRDN